MQKIVIGNLKMNILSPIERQGYLSNFKKELGGKKIKKTEIVLCPQSIHIEAFRQALGKRVKIGAQNMFWKREGAFTGEISPQTIKNFGCEYVILGHSERRKYFCETSEEINLKVIEALKIGLKPVICIGESKTEKDSNQTMNVVTRQIKEVLAEINRTKIENIVIVYEPIWAVGSDVVPSAHEIMEVRLLIQKILVGLFDKKYASLVPILYGGSVNAKIASDVCIEPGMDGALVGRESLVPYEFIKIAEIIND